MKRMELESLLCDVQKKLDERKTFYNLKSIALKQARENMEGAREEWNMHRLNMEHMKSDKPPSVDIKEYVVVRDLLVAANETYTDAISKAHNLSAVIATYDRQNEDDNREVDRIRALLDKCGTILQFPKKAT
jgi:hypothetical protein